MPTPPASATTRDFSMRSLTPRRQSTTLPATAAGSSVSGSQSAASVSGTAGVALACSASTTGVGVLSACVTEAPWIVKAGPLDGVIVAVASNVRASVPAATVVSQGTAAGAPTVPGSGPSLPAEFETKTPASDAPRNAYDSASMTVGVDEPTE